MVEMKAEKRWDFNENSTRLQSGDLRQVQSHPVKPVFSRLLNKSKKAGSNIFEPAFSIFGFLETIQKTTSV
jgi:hypothetical protein